MARMPPPSKIVMRMIQSKRTFLDRPNHYKAIAALQSCANQQNGNPQTA